MPRLTAHEALAQVLGCDRDTAAEIIADLAQYGYFIWPDVLIEAVRRDTPVREIDER